MSTRPDTMSENADIETGSNADPKAPGDPSAGSGLGATPCSPGSSDDPEIDFGIIGEARLILAEWSEWARAHYPAHARGLIGRTVEFLEENDQEHLPR